MSVDYSPPVSEQCFVLDIIADISHFSNLPAFEFVTPELIESVLQESSKLARDIFAPLNRIGDREGATWKAGSVTLPEGFAEAYRAYVVGGWSSLGARPEFGGQGLPFVLACAVQEQISSANMAFSLNMMLSQGAVIALEKHGTEEQKSLYLTKLVSGEWTGTMNLTEPQAGSDVGELKTKAIPTGDGSYRIEGSKIFISWGEHDLAENIVHLVLARLPGAPVGTKGISLFLVPKYLSDGTRNDVRCTAIEHKLGIHASPTCAMRFGDEGQCIGWLVGPENKGMQAMFTMMNHARISVGLQGVAIAERSYQHALSYARERVQKGRIVDHPDVRRMLMTMKSYTEAARALTYLNAAAVDQAQAANAPHERAAAQGLADLLTPVTKAFATDIGVDVASLGIQIFGGMGYIEETGAAQHLRDARIAPIYEGTNGIQALDLVERKLGMDGGEHWRRLFEEIASFADTLDGQVSGLRKPLKRALEALESTTSWLVIAREGKDAAAGATPYLRMFGLVMSAYLLARQAAAATALLTDGKGSADFLAAKIATAYFFATQILPEAEALLPAVTAGSASLYAIDEDQLG